MGAKGEKQVYFHPVHLYAELHNFHDRMIIWTETGDNDATNESYASELAGTDRSTNQKGEHQESLKTFPDKMEVHGIDHLIYQLEKVYYLSFRYIWIELQNQSSDLFSKKKCPGEFQTEGENSPSIS